MRKNEKGFGVVEIIGVAVIIGLIGAVIWLVYDRQQNKKDTDNKSAQNTAQQTKKTTKQDEPTATGEVTTQYLEIPEYGVKIELTDGIEDAYYAMDQSYPYLSVHALDKYSDCKISDGNSSGSIAAVAKAKVGDDNFGSPWTQVDLEKISKLKIGDNYYWIEGSNGGGCSDPNGSDANTESTARKVFTSAKLLKL